MVLCSWFCLCVYVAQTRNFISKMLASEDVKELVRSQQGREFVISLMKTEMALDDDP